jgi:hypothetical protein
MQGRVPGEVRTALIKLAPPKSKQGGLIEREGRIVAVNFGRIIINGHAAGSVATNYEDQVKGILLSIMMFSTGRAVIRAIESSHRRLHIVPRQATNQNAFTHPSNYRDATNAGEPVHDGMGRHRQEWGVGTGHGTPSLIRYTPWVFPNDMLPRWDAIATRNWLAILGWQPVASGLDAEEVLLHEMVHALEQMSGRLSTRRLGYGFDTLSEFHAILVVNVFAREHSRTPRQNHSGFNTAISQSSIIPNQAEFWSRVDAFRVRHPQLAKDLAAVTVWGNPFQFRPAPAPPH